ncbi:ribonuclease M5 [Salinibacillus xinjiangensis]|uniref:Ribonuclease M5 n=1 Tax=Salinibacillus xinjiangensis TaxID=1229268 RepID=A0A6G1XB78_9BACI|nr:ribonuclease M5 [Salinibacillus xinjiangensis]MRG88165.1 ribonuclease M5 [Salinibacillus xinjiangensis]
MYIKEIIVVEGKDDTTAVKRAVNADTIETNGSAVNQSTLNQIKHAQEKRGVIIFTDPDYPGQRIRSIIDESVPGCKHAFLPREQAIGTKGLGIEHATSKDIQAALKKVYEVTGEPDVHFTKSDLIDFGLVGSQKASDRRKKLGEKLNIGFTNAKQLEKRLNIFRVSKADFIASMEEILQEEQKDGK